MASLEKMRWHHCERCGLWFVFPRYLPDGTPVCPRCGAPIKAEP
jgi:uncharacterized Zn finger protein (UPF0148 family)